MPKLGSFETWEETKATVVKIQEEEALRSRRVVRRKRIIWGTFALSLIFGLVGLYVAVELLQGFSRFFIGMLSAFLFAIAIGILIGYIARANDDN